MIIGHVFGGGQIDADIRKEGVRYKVAQQASSSETAPQLSQVGAVVSQSVQKDLIGLTMSL